MNLISKLYKQVSATAELWGEGGVLKKIINVKKTIKTNMDLLATICGEGDHDGRLIYRQLSELCVVYI